MSNPYRTRGGLNRPSKQPREHGPRVRELKFDEAKYLHQPSQSQVVADANKFNNNSEVIEDREGYLIPRKSLTHKYSLGNFPQDIEVEVMKGRQLDHCKTSPTFGQMVDFTYNRLVWKSDKTLLDPTKVDAKIGGSKGFKRITSHTKRMITEPREVPYEQDRIDLPDRKRRR